MGTCILNQGYTLVGNCKSDNSHGGIFELYLGSFNKNDTYTINSSNSAITSISLTNSLYRYQQPLETVDFQQPGQYNEDGTHSFLQTVAFTLHQISAVTRNTLIKLSDAHLICIIKDIGSNYWICGRTTGMNVIESNASLNKLFTDPNSISITLQAEEPEPFDLLTEEAFNTLTVV